MDRGGHQSCPAQLGLNERELAPRETRGDRGQRADTEYSQQTQRDSACRHTDRQTVRQFSVSESIPSTASRHSETAPANRQIDRQSDSQTLQCQTPGTEHCQQTQRDSTADRQTDRQIDRQTDRRTDSQTDRQTDSSVSQQVPNTASRHSETVSWTDRRQVPNTTIGPVICGDGEAGVLLWARRDIW